MVYFFIEWIVGLFEDGEEVDLCRDYVLFFVYFFIVWIIGVLMIDMNYFVDMGECVFGGSCDLMKVFEVVQELGVFFKEKYEV